MIGCRPVALVGSLLACLSGSVSAATLHVPREHKTIQGAITVAASGDTVLVEAGVYRERIRFRTGVHLRSAGDDSPGTVGLKRAEATIIEGEGQGAREPAVILAEGAILDGFSVTRVGLFDPKEYDRHHATYGELLPDEQGAVGVGGPPVAVELRGITATVRHCIVRDNGHAGIGCLGEPGKRNASVITANVVLRNMGGGIGIASGASPLVERNRCSQNLRGGIGNRNSRATILNNECFDNVRAGIGIREGATPIVRGNRCYRNRRAGIGVRMKGTNPILEENDCHDNEMAGIGVRDGAAPVIRGNRCHRNRMAGIGCRDGASPLIEQNECFENEMAGIGARNGATPTIRNNRCHHNQMAGIGCRDGARPIIEGNRCYENAMAGIGSRDGAVPVIRGNRCYNNEMAGIGSRLGARPLIVDNDCFENRLAGIGSREGAFPHILKNRCYRNDLAGIGVREGAHALIEGNECKENRLAGIGVRQGAVVELLNNRCLENGKVAIGIRQGSAARIIGNELIRTGGMPPMIALGEGSRAIISENRIQGGGVCGILIEGTAWVTDNRMQGKPEGSGSAIWALAKSDITVRGNRVDRYRNLLDNTGCKVEVCDNTISGFRGTAITIRKPLAPVLVRGNVALSKDPQARVLLLEDAQERGGQNSVKPPEEAERSVPADDRLWSRLPREGVALPQRSGEETVEMGPWKLVVVHGKTTTYQLHHRLDDPGLKKDLSSQMESLVFRMRGQLERKEAGEFRARLRQEAPGR